VIFAKRGTCRLCGAAIPRFMGVACAQCRRRADESEAARQEFLQAVRAALDATSAEGAQQEVELEQAARAIRLREEP